MLTQSRASLSTHDSLRQFSFKAQQATGDFPYWELDKACYHTRLEERQNYLHFLTYKLSVSSSSLTSSMCTVDITQGIESPTTHQADAPTTRKLTEVGEESCLSACSVL